MLHDRFNARSVFSLALLLTTAVSCIGQQPETAQPDASPKPALAAKYPENLNYIGGDTSMPPMSDSPVSASNPFHKAVWERGVALRVIAQAVYTQNTLHAPVAADEQVYVGQLPFQIGMVQPILSADLRQLHLKQAQLYIGGDFDWVSWRPAGPKTFQLWDLYFYKAFGEDRVQIKAGYVSMNLDFIGLFVGGSTAAGGQGVYAVLPYEAGMSYFPLTSPGATLRLKATRNTYLKFGVQRSMDPDGGPAEVRRNHTGFRFTPHGDKALLLQEAGYLRKATRDAHELWLRGGYLYNTTPYKNLVTGEKDSGNHCAFALVDYQVLRSSLEHPNQGLYVGGSYMTVPESLNGYARYGELRVYKEAPLRSRPADLVSVVASRTEYSTSLVKSLQMQGKTAWQGSSTLTASYSLRAAAGSYLNFSASYINGPAITPRVPSALNLTAGWTVFF
ncbi:MAG: carbohydrate porin [Acidobacteria bacterium]|nr:carbohydrate porin [Acidobacteriota bacterium]